MPFWSTSTVTERLTQSKIITPFTPELVRQAAVQLRVGPQAAKSCDGPTEITQLEPGVVFSIPPGQFALLLTDEVVQLPADVLAFISVKTRYKARGLVNVSGFHVDPGFHGRLKFWVYNAGNQVISVQRGDPAFHIWFADFDHAVSDLYRNETDQNVISSEDISKMQHGEVSTPAALRKDVDTLERKLEILDGRTKLIIGALITIGIGILMMMLTKYISAEKPSVLTVKVDPTAPSVFLAQAAPPPSTPPKSSGHAAEGSSTSIRVQLPRNSADASAKPASAASHPKGDPNDLTKQGESSSP